MTAEIEVLQPGLHSSIQDLGRYGFRKFGVPTGGAMDRQSAGMANLILGNNREDAVLEITLQGPKLSFLGPAIIAITGAELSPDLDGVKLENNSVYKVNKDQVLSFGRRISGYRAYLGVKNGFQINKILESRSWCPGITPFERLEKGMKLPFLTGGAEVELKNSVIKPGNYPASGIIEAYPGPEYEFLSASEKNKLQKWHFSVAKESNRMGIRFQEKFENKLDPILTSPVLPGTVQLTPSGTLIALMRDGQTTGGYPRILQISEVGINTLAQKLPGESLQLKLINYK